MRIPLWHYSIKLTEHRSGEAKAFKGHISQVNEGYCIKLVCLCKPPQINAVILYKKHTLPTSDCVRSYCQPKWTEGGRGAWGRTNTYLWEDCCCSWRRSQRCCWMPWQRSLQSLEFWPQPMSTDLRQGTGRLTLNMNKLWKREEKRVRESTQESCSRLELESPLATKNLWVCDYHRNPKPQACKESSSSSMC